MMHQQFLTVPPHQLASVTWEIPNEDEQPLIEKASVVRYRHANRRANLTPQQHHVDLHPVNIHEASIRPPHLAPAHQLRHVSENY